MTFLAVRWLIKAFIGVAVTAILIFVILIQNESGDTVLKIPIEPI